MAPPRARSVRIEGQPDVKAGLVLDVDTGLIRGVAVGSSVREAVAQALTLGFTRPAGSLPPGRPKEVLCRPGLSTLVEGVLSSLSEAAPSPTVREVEPPAEAEDIFDSFVGQMAGRSQPMEPPSPPDWALLYSNALRFYRAAPWARWHDAIILALEVKLGGARTRYAAVVLGNAGLEYGLLLYPGDDVPSGLEEWEPGQAPPAPPGTHSCTLAPPDELPDDIVAKALRYGWPPDADLVPVLLRIGGEGEGGDPSGAEVQTLTTALTAVISHDERGPVPVAAGAGSTNGRVVLGDGRSARFSISQRAPRPGPGGPRFRVHQAGSELVPEGAPVILGYLGWDLLAEFRATARIFRPFPPGVPGPSGSEVPLLVIVADPDRGPALAAKAAELDPDGVHLADGDDGRAVFVRQGNTGS